MDVVLPSPSRFLDLPTEIRLRIYEHLFAGPDFSSLSAEVRTHVYKHTFVGHDFSWGMHKTVVFPRESWIRLGILFVSKQLHSESRPAMFRKSLIELWHEVAFDDAKTHHSPFWAKVAPFLQHVDICMAYRVSPEKVTRLDNFTNIRSLQSSVFSGIEFYNDEHAKCFNDVERNTGMPTSAGIAHLLSGPENLVYDRHFPGLWILVKYWRRSKKTKPFELIIKMDAVSSDEDLCIRQIRTWVSCVLSF